MTSFIHLVLSSVPGSIGWSLGKFYADLLRLRSRALTEPAREAADGVEVPSVKCGRMRAHSLSDEKSREIN